MSTANSKPVTMTVYPSQHGTSKPVTMTLPSIRFMRAEGGDVVPQRPAVFVGGVLTWLAPAD